MIWDRDSIKWFKPARGQFQVYCHDGADQREYVPDFVAEDTKYVYMLEPKASDETDEKVVLAKQAAAKKWFAIASDHTASYSPIYRFAPRSASQIPADERLHGCDIES